MRTRSISFCLLLLLAVSAWGRQETPSPLNPVLTGADPHAVWVGEVLWIYPTHYAPGQAQLFAYSSKNMQDWERHGPILQLDDIAWIKDDGAKKHKLWAPCIIEKEGKFYLYYSVGPQNPTPSRLGVAVGDAPAGPFADSGKPLLIGGDGFEAIDPMVFHDDTSNACYLYAGGSAGATLRVFELSEDMLELAREIPVDTPPHFTEGAFMHQRNGRYYLSYSSGRHTDASYSAHYATAETPVGPWKYGGVFLKSDENHKGPGHHSFFHLPASDHWFVAYHRWNHQRGLGPYHAARQTAIDCINYEEDGAIVPVTMTGGNTQFRMAPEASPPGVVVHHIPQATGLYIGSPSIAVLPNGDYLASHDYFGPESNEHECATAQVHCSKDKGEHWQPLARLQCLFWPRLFVHKDAVYIMGVTQHHGRIVIRRSDDNGATWTEPTDAAKGLLTPEGEYHTAPMPVIEHDGRLWRAFEDAMGGERWGERYRAFMMSIPVEADLLDAANWTFSNVVARDPEWLQGDFRGWIEGNAVLDRNGHIVDVLRVDTPGYPEKAAIIQISGDGKKAVFDPETGFIDFPGGAKKFTIRYDDAGGLYWAVVTPVLEKHQEEGSPGGIRNTLALSCSKDLRQWEIRTILLHHPDVKAHGFQYVDWQFDGNDIIALCRTAYQDGIGGARNNHDANFLTFHRIKDFRTLTR